MGWTRREGPGCGAINSHILKKGTRRPLPHAMRRGWKAILTAITFRRGRLHQRRCRQLFREEEVARPWEGNDRLHPCGERHARGAKNGPPNGPLPTGDHHGGVGLLSHQRSNLPITQKGGVHQLVNGVQVCVKQSTASGPGQWEKKKKC